MIDYPSPELNLISGPISIATVALAFLIHHFTMASDGFERWIKARFPDPAASIRKVMIRRLLAVALFGGGPLGIVLAVYRDSPARYGFSSDHLWTGILWGIPLALVGVCLSYFGAGSKQNLEMYLQIRIGQWNARLLFLSALSWIAYLFAYEFMFRGFLLFSCLETFGYWPSIAINSGIYALVHVSKGPREAFGSVFFGFGLCLLSLYLGSIWAALFVHISMALSHEWFSLSLHTGMSLAGKNRAK